MVIAGPFQMVFAGTAVVIPDGLATDAPESDQHGSDEKARQNPVADPELFRTGNGAPALNE